MTNCFYILYQGEVCARTIQSVFSTQDVYLVNKNTVFTYKHVNNFMDLGFFVLSILLIIYKLLCSKNDFVTNFTMTFYIYYHGIKKKTV